MPIGLKDLESQILRTIVGTRAFSSPALAIGTTKSKVTTGGECNYCIDGKVYRKAATADVFTHQDVGVQADGTTCYYGCFLDSSGAGTIYKGSATALPEIPVLNGVPTKCLVGALKVVCAGAAFTPGTTLHDAANITVTYYNMSTVPVSGLPG